MKSAVQSVLEDDHDSLDQLLQELDAELATASPTAIELLDLFWARLATHIRAEHFHLFPAITQGAAQESGDPRSPALREVEQTLATLRSDHDFFMKELAGMMKTARSVDIEATADNFKRRLLEIRKRLAAHNRIEEQQVYLWPISILNEAKMLALSNGVRKELDNLPPRFVEHI